MRLILDEAARTSRELPLTALHAQLLERAEAEGYGELDNSVIIRDRGRVVAGDGERCGDARDRGLSSLLDEVE